MNATENFGFDDAVIMFPGTNHSCVFDIFPRGPTRMLLVCRLMSAPRLAGIFVAQISNALSQVFSAVEHLILSTGT